MVVKKDGRGLKGKLLYRALYRAVSTVVAVRHGKY